MSSETETIARILASGFNNHIRLHGPDADFAGEAIETADGHGLVITRDGVQYGVRVERLQPLTEPGPLTPGQCWAALKEDLSTRIKQDDAVHREFLAAGDMATAAPYGGLVSANRTTLAKMRELEAGSG